MFFLAKAGGSRQLADASTHGKALQSRLRLGKMSFVEPFNKIPTPP